MFNTLLSKVYYEEALQEAAQERADRKAQIGNGARNIIGGFLFMLVATPVIFWLVR